MRLQITETFKFAHRGVEVREYQAGDTVDTDDQELIDISTREGWAKVAEPEDAPAADHAPENKAGAPRSRKA
jgi:hypothetical protein